MTVPTTLSAVKYTATGLNSIYPYTWQIADDADLVVYTLVPGGTPTLLELTTEYTVSGAGIPTGGNVTLLAGNLTAGNVLLIASDPSQIQALLIQQGAAFNPGDLMASLDLLTREVQATRRVANNSIQIPLVESLDSVVTTLPIAATRAATLLGFDVNGNVTTTAQTIALTQLNAVASVAALKLVSAPASGAIYATGGYYAIGDEGAATYVWNASDTTGDNGGTVIKVTAIATGRFNLLHKGVIDVMWFGAKGDGSTDDTTAIDAAATYAWSISGVLWFGPHTFYYNGAGLSNSSMAIIGSGRGKTTIKLNTAKYFVVSSIAWSNFVMRDLTVNLGAGAIHQTFAGVNVASLMVIEDCDFTNYTVCAISDECSDAPYRKIHRCQFKGANDTTTIGVALSGLTDCDSVVDCSFLTNAVGLKIRHGGNNCYVENCDFIFFNAYVASARVKLWVVPLAATPINAGPGLSVRACKFGNENMNVADHHVLYADEGSGTGNNDMLPSYGADSTGYCVGHSFQDIEVSGIGSSGSPSFLYTTTPQIYACHYSFTIAGTPPKYIVEYRTAPTPDRLNGSNVFGPFYGQAIGVDQLPSACLLSNGIDVGRLIDPLAQFNDPAQFLPQFGGSDVDGYVRLLTSSISAFGFAGGATASAITDALGGSDAVEMAMGSGGIATKALDIQPTTGVPSWIEFGVKQGTGTPMTVAMVQIRYTSNGAIFLQRSFIVGAGWTRFRFPFISREVSASVIIEFLHATGDTTNGTLDIERVRCYAGREPVNTDMAVPGGGRIRSRWFKTPSLNVNQTNTDLATITGLPAKYRVVRFTAMDASTSLTTATVDLRTAAAGAGTALAAAAVLSACTAATKDPDLTLQAVAGTDYQTAAILTIRAVTAQGGAATVAFLVEVIDLTG